MSDRADLEVPDKVSRWELEAELLRRRIAPMRTFLCMFCLRPLPGFIATPPPFCQECDEMMTAKLNDDYAALFETREQG